MMNTQTLQAISGSEEELKQRFSHFEDYQRQDIPVFKYGMGISASLQGLELNQIDPLKQKAEVSITDGNPELEILTFAQALEKHPKIFEEMQQQFAQATITNKLTALHEAFHDHNIFIRIPAGLQATEPLTINTTLLANTRIDTVYIFAGENSQANIVCATQSKLHEKTFHSRNVCALLKENATLSLNDFQDIHENTHTFVRRNMFLAKNSTLHFAHCTIGNGFTQASTSIKLQGEGAHAENKGAIFGKNTQFFDINDETEHLAPHTTSNMFAKIALNDHAKNIYRGLVKIHPGMDGCEGHQKDDTILLSETAEADAVPNLEICNNDVQCSHGATISQLDEEKLFYMQSRGIPLLTAKRVILEGFFADTLAQFKNPLIKTQAEQAIHKRLEEVC